MSATTEALRKVPLFSQLDDKTLGRLEKMSRERTFDTGDDIVRQGDEGSGAFVIINGKVEVLRDGRKLADLGAGNFFGEMALLDNYRRSATVRALEPTRCIVIPRSDFVAELHGNNELCFQMLRLMSRRVREVEQALTTE
jgi:CRP-like cAMP-binding protein